MLPGYQVSVRIGPELKAAGPGQAQDLTQEIMAAIDRLQALNTEPDN